MEACKDQTPVVGPDAMRKSAMAAAATKSGLSEKVAAYLGKYADAKKRRNEYCYRHNPSLSGHRGDALTLQSMQHELESFDKDDCQVISQIWSVFAAAPGKQRRVILRGLLGQCCLPQLSEVATIIKDLVRIDFIAAMPIELAFKILGYLDARSLAVASMVSTRWKELAEDDYVWYHLCEQHIDRKCTRCGWGLPLLDRKRLRKSKQQVMQRLETLTSQEKALPGGSPRVGATNINCGSDSRLSDLRLDDVITRKRKFDDSEASATPEPRGEELIDASGEPCEVVQRQTRPWKEVYIERYKVENNWRKGRCSTQVFHHPSPVLCLQFDEEYLMTGTYDGRVNIWCVVTGKLLRTLEGHLRAVSALKFDRCKLITGSWDQSVRLWNYKTGRCLSTFGGLDDKVLCIDSERNLIAAGSGDATVKVWDFRDKSCFTLRGHREPVHSVRIHPASQTLYSSSEDLTVRMWDLRTKQCIRVFGGPNNGPTAHVAQIQQALPMTIEHLETEDDHHHLHNVDGGHVESEPSVDKRDDDAAAQRPTHLLTASLDNTIKLWDISTGRCARTLFGHVEGVWCIAADNFRIISGAHDETVKVWDIQSGKCWHTFSGHTRPVCCVGLSDTGFASGGDDGLVKLYSFDI